MMSRKCIQGFLFQPRNYSADESDFGDNDVSHDYDKMIYTGIYDFQLSHIESLNWYSCGTVTERVCLLQMQSSSLL